MGHSFVLWTASFLASGVAQGQVVTTSTPAPMATHIQGNCNCGTPSAPVRTITLSQRGTRSANEPGQTFVSKLQERLSGLFGTKTKSKNNDSDVIYESTVDFGTPVAEPTPVIMNRMPNKVSFNEPPLNGAKEAATASLPAVSMQGAGEATPVAFRPAQTKVATVIQAKFTNRVGHEVDYSWVTGQLGQVNNRWVIHYASANTIDRFNGSLVLAGTADMNAFSIGDLVSIQGGVIQTTSHGPAYLIQSINLIERK